jgi:hypothetical protein
MVTLAGLAPMLLAAALAAGPDTGPSPPTVPELPITPDEETVPLLARRMQACDSGGMGTESCDVNCHVAFNFYTTQCNVSCRSGYYACCSCDTGCHCVMDHDEMWPAPPGNPIP